MKEASQEDERVASKFAIVFIQDDLGNNNNNKEIKSRTIIATFGSVQYYAF